ncbi:hypothetical protein BDV27DRAFT_162381 [Aspergillus caelatus]|uniref:NACHT domain-containing protein n=1 Tax=Aspergillus caelatus TaxID=61420 RepID=A0A5N6ZS71_9EURO|nr:uncharacterized protein BDV27DRAFT_162381 [Aspergillus caelatus]KAE8359699.1 hypothetical protein BDV27DRAFT_162381 [Aspergillus caelatus]
MATEIEAENDYKQDSAETAECPVSETTPTDEKAVDRSDKSGNTDLWQRAFDEPSEGLKGRLRENEAISPANAIEEVINSTKVSFEAYQNGGLKFKKYDGKEVNVHDVARKILMLAIQCSDIIKGLAAFDPSNHASSAWGIVSLGLTMAKNFMDQREAAFKSSEFLADILARYVILDGYCRTKKLPSSVGLDDAIVKVYKAILEYTAEVKKRQSASVLRNSVFPLSDTELNNLLSTVQDQDQKVSNWSQINHYIYQSTKGDEILASIGKVHQNTEIIKVKVNLDQQHKILTWLSDIQYSYTQNDHQNVRTDNTGDWLLSSGEYRKWKATPGKTLALYGPAGCGKSILCSTVIKDIEKDCSNNPSSIFSYWYFQFNLNETQNVKNMTRSIIRQLIPEEFPRSLVNLWKEHDRQNRDPDQDEFLTVLDDVINSHTGDHVFLIFDALDECPDNEAYERNMLFQVLKDLIDKHGKKIHLLATSRYEENIRCHLEESLKIDLEDRMNDDVEAFVRDALDHGKLSRWKKVKGVNDQILAKLLDTKEPRRFRWADLQIKRLEKCKTNAQITESLETIPNTLEETYHRILQEIPEDEQEYARTILTWLSFSFEPLELETVAAVVDFPHPEDVVETCTTHLVTVSPSTGTIKLAHFSVKEFLVVSHPKHWYQLTTIGGHMDIANRVLDDLLGKTELLSKTPRHGLQLSKYAADHWDGHFSELTDYGAKFPDLDKKIYRLFEERIVYLNWRYMARAGRLLPRYIENDVVEPPIYLACHMGIQNVVERLLSQGAKPCTEFYDSGGFNWSTFRAAGWNGHLTILNQLLGKIEISAKIAVVIARSIDLNMALPEEVEALLNKLLSSKSLYSGATVPLDLWIIGDFISWAPAEVVELLLQIRGDEIQVTETLLMNAADADWDNDTAFRLLWQKREPDIEITSTILQRIASGYNGLKCMEVVLTECARGYFLEHEVLQEVAKSKHGLPLMRMLLNKREAGLVAFDISEATMIAAASNQDWPQQMMELVINNADSEILINKKILYSAISNYLKGESALKYLLGHYKNLPITEEVLVSAAADGRHNVLRFLFNEFPHAPVTDRVFKATKSGFKVLSLWLKGGHHVQDCQVIGSLLEQGIVSLQELTELLDEGLVEIDDKLVDAVGIQKALIMALHGHYAMEKLLDLRGNDIAVPEEVVLKALDEIRVDDEAFKMLADRLGSAVPRTEKILRKAFLNDQSKLLDLLLKDGRNWNLENVWDTIRRGDKGEFGCIVRAANALLQYGEFDLSQTLLEFLPFQVDKYFGYKDLRDLANLCAGRDISAPATEMLAEILFGGAPEDTIYICIDGLRLAVPTSEKVWDALWQNDISLMHKVRVSKILLQYGQLDISQTLLRFLPIQAEKYSSDRDLDELVNLCAERDISAPAAEMLSALLFARGSEYIIKKFIEHKPTIQLTDYLLGLACKNERIDTTVLMPFLYSKRAADQNVKVESQKQKTSSRYFESPNLSI